MPDELNATFPNHQTSAMRSTILQFVFCVKPEFFAWQKFRNFYEILKNISSSYLDRIICGWNLYIFAQ